MQTTALSQEVHIGIKAGEKIPLIDVLNAILCGNLRMRHVTEQQNIQHRNYKEIREFDKK